MLNSKRVHGAVYAFAFLIPAAVFLCVYAGMGMAPWGDKTILATDMSGQYVEFFCGLKYGDLFFSWSKALGSSYIGVISYYVSSPLSLLTLLVPNEYMPVGLMFLAALKAGLAGLTCSIFVLRRFPETGNASLLCAVCYALMSYNAAYSLCIMWLDGVIWLPIILLGIERVLQGRGKLLLTASLAVCFLSTWYISYMIGIFCCLYLAFRLISLRPGWAAAARRTGTMLSCAALALCLTAWMWLPTFLAMFTGKFSGANPTDYDGAFTCSVLDLLGQFLPGQYNSLTNSGKPFLYCGAAMLLLFLAGFFCRSIPLREKLASVGVVLVLLASMLLSALDKAWHLFRLPAWFPYRYSFVLSCFLVVGASRALVPVLAAWKRRVPPRTTWLVSLAVLTLTIVELGYNTASIFYGVDRQFGYESYREYAAYYRANAALTQAAREDSGLEFCRMGAVEDRGQNSPLSFGYPGITHYSSLYNNDVNVLLRSLGFAQSWMWSAYYGSTPVTDALFDVRYVFSEQDMPGYQEIARSGELAVWKNPTVLPLAFLTPAPAELTVDQNGTVFERQNALLSALAGQDAAVFTPVHADIQAGAEEAVLTFVGTGAPVYANLSSYSFQSVTVDGEFLAALGTSETVCVRCLGAPAPGEVCTVTLRYQENANINWTHFLWQADLSVLDAAVRTLDDTRVLSVDNRTVTVEAQADDAGLLATTIPAEAGWTAYVDGQRAETRTFLNTFLAVPLEAGSHTVTFRYLAPGLRAGLGLGGLAVVFLAAAGTKTRMTRQRRPRKTG